MNLSVVHARVYYSTVIYKQLRKMANLLRPSFALADYAIDRRVTFGTSDALDFSPNQGGPVYLRARVVLPSVNDPLHHGNDEDDAERHNGVVHVIRGYWDFRRKDKQDSREQGPRNTNLGTPVG